MGEYLIVKWVHILSSTILFGTGIGSAFYMLMASRRGDPRVVHFVARNVVVADATFTTLAVIVQPLTGAYLVHLAGYTWTSAWILWSALLYLFAGACWLPVVWLQVRMREMAKEAAASGQPLPPRYFTFHRAWVALGIPAFMAVLIVFWLMVAKPV
jgi:uncharacterized membrane protein